MRGNILLITADQWRADSLGAAGHPNVRTPHVDRLARDGTRFAQHYAQAAPCSPARACLYTGLYQMTNRVLRNGTPLDARHDNMALAARRAGYDPTLFGYTDQSADPRHLPANDPWLRTYEGVLPGFSVRLRVDEEEAVYLSWLKLRGVTVPDGGYPDVHVPVGAPADPPSAAPPVYGPDETQTAFLTDEFIRWLSEQGGTRPWFAHISFLRPHPPFIVPEPYASMVAPDDVPATAVAGGPAHPLTGHLLATLDKSSFVASATGPITDWSEADIRQIRATYYGMIAEVDAQLGRIFDALQAAGAWDDTLIILTSDHGEMLGDYRLFAKGAFYDASYHIPLVVRDPRSDARGHVVTAFTESIDVKPTILDWLGADMPQHLDGRSLTPFLRGETPDAWRDAAHWEFDFRDVDTGRAQSALGLDIDACSLAVRREARWKYVHCAGLPPLLFDLESEDSEARDLADDPDHQPVRLEMAEKLLAWRARHLDRTLTNIELTPEGPVTAARV